MKSTPFEFDGKTYALSFTAEALFAVYDKYGVGDILSVTGCMEATAEGYKHLCWLAALMAAQGELMRRRQGYDAQPMLTADQLRSGLMAADAVRLRQTVKEALEQGFRRDVPPEEEEAKEVNLVLLEREEVEKKTKAAVASALDTLLSAVLTSISPQSTH